MTNPSPIIPTQLETVAELRDLYRAAEARAARLRLLSEAGSELAVARGDNIAGPLQSSARRLAHFIGFPHGSVNLAKGSEGIAIHAPGQAETPVGFLDIPGLGSIDEVDDFEDRTTVIMYLQLLGTTIDRLARDAERAALLAALQERERRLEQLLSRLLTAQEEERRRVSCELHDGVAQRAAALFRMLEAQSMNGATGGSDASARTTDIARDLVQELRQVIAGLRPTILDDLGLEHALRSLAADLRAEGHDVRETIEASGTRRPTAVETAFFRVAQEAMSNIGKHAGGNCRVDVNLRAVEDDPTWVLSIRDYGQGVQLSDRLEAPALERSHIGIEVMRERMAAIGGQLLWEMPQDGGVRVTAAVEWRG